VVAGGRESHLEDGMGKEQLAVFRGRSGLRNSRPSDTPISTRLADESLPPHPLSILALASSVRLDDPREEHERVVMLEIAIVAGREAARALDRWLSQSLAEYRGSRTAWDLKATTGELRQQLDQFDGILRDTADRLIALIPGLIDGMPEYVSLSASRPTRRRVLDEVAAVSRLLDAIESRPTAGSDRTESSPAR
jgi:hypothetical protein